jgi:hypothetical protein
MDIFYNSPDLTQFVKYKIKQTVLELYTRVIPLVRLNSCSLSVSSCISFHDILQYHIRFLLIYDVPSYASLGPFPSSWLPGNGVLGSCMFSSQSLLPRHLVWHHVKSSFDLSVVVLCVVVFKIQVLTHVGWTSWELGAFVALLNHGTSKVIFVYMQEIIFLCIFHVEWSCCWT